MIIYKKLLDKFKTSRSSIVQNFLFSKIVNHLRGGVPKKRGYNPNFALSFKISTARNLGANKISLVCSQNVVAAKHALSFRPWLFTIMENFRHISALSQGDSIPSTRAWVVLPPIIIASRCKNLGIKIYPGCGDVFLSCEAGSIPCFEVRSSHRVTG